MSRVNLTGCLFGTGVFETIAFIVYEYSVASRYYRMLAVGNRWSTSNLRLCRSVPVPTGSDDAVAGLIYSVGDGAGHCSASILTVLGCFRLRYRSILYVRARSRYRLGFFVMMTGMIRSCSHCDVAVLGSWVLNVDTQAYLVRCTLCRVVLSVDAP